MIPVFYSDAYVLADHAFDTTRKARSMCSDGGVLKPGALAQC